MRLSLGLEARQVQVQKLAPRMIQSMEILQLPLMELQERFDLEMSENPTLLADADLDGESDTERTEETTGGCRAPSVGLPPSKQIS